MEAGMADQQGRFAGSCLCGGVRYEITGTPDRFFLCHCSRCRKGTGSAHASNIFLGDAALTWLAGADLVKSFSVEGSRHGRSFCSACGSPLPQQQPGDRVKLPAGSLDSPAGMLPLAHIFVASRADWDDHLETVPAFDDRPG